MAKKKKTSSARGAHGMAPGWVQQQSQIPEQFRRMVRDTADQRGHGTMRSLATIAYGILLGMPAEVRTGLVLWAQSKIARDGSDIDPVEVYRMFDALVNADDGKSSEDRMVRLLVQAMRGDVEIPATEGKGRKAQRD